MQQLSKFLLIKAIRPNIIAKLNTNSPSNKQYKFSFKKNFTEAIQRIFHDLNNWYVNMIGLAEVKKYQDRVVHVQAQLLETQEKRREVSKLLGDVRIKSNELQDQIHKLKREDDLDKFLDVMRQETEVLRKEKELSRVFNECDRAERDLFTAFTNAVRESHEKQRTQLEYTKYLGLGLSIIGSFLTFCYSSLKKHELKSFIDQKLRVYPVPAPGNFVQMQKELKGFLEVINKDTSRLFKQNSDVVNKNHKELMTTLSTLNTNIMAVYKNILKNDVSAQNVQAFQNNVTAENAPPPVPQLPPEAASLIILFVFSCLLGMCGCCR